MEVSPCSVVGCLTPLAHGFFHHQKQPVPQQHQGLCPCSHVSVGTAGALVAGRASLSSPGCLWLQLWLLAVQSSQAMLGWELGATDTEQGLAQLQERQRSGSPVPKGHLCRSGV